MRFVTILSSISAIVAALVVGVDSQTGKVKIMALGDSITGSPVSNQQSDIGRRSFYRQVC